MSVKNNNAEVVLSALTLRVRREGRKEGEGRKEVGEDRGRGKKGRKERKSQIDCNKSFLPWQTK